MTTIATTIRLPDEGSELLRSVGEVNGPDGWLDSLPVANALLCTVAVKIDQTLLDSAPRLSIVANAGVGFDNIDLAACRQRGIIVTNTPDVLTDATADIAIALLLSAVRGMTFHEARLRAGEFGGWTFWDHLSGDVTGSRLGIYGMGRIGQAVARRARPFGMSVVYHNRRRLPPEVERELEATWVSWDSLLEESDIISIHAPSTPETHHVFDDATLRRMKPGSYLINTARGSLVDEDALVRALRNGPLAGAGLDVYEREPVVHPGLLELPNVTLLPHVGSASVGTRTAMAMLAVRNVVAVLSGGEPLTPVG